MNLRVASISRILLSILSILEMEATLRYIIIMLKSTAELLWNIQNFIHDNTCLTCKSHLDCVKKYRARFSSTPAILQNCTIRLPSVALLSYSAISYTTCRHNSTQRELLPRRTNRASLGSTRTFQNLLFKSPGIEAVSFGLRLGKAGLF